MSKNSTSLGEHLPGLYIVLMRKKRLPTKVHYSKSNLISLARFGKKGRGEIGGAEYRGNPITNRQRERGASVQKKKGSY